MAETVTKMTSYITRIKQLLSYFRDPGHLFLSFSILHSQYISSSVLGKVPPPFEVIKVTGWPQQLQAAPAEEEGKIHSCACF